MPEYLSPGVYVEEVPSGNKPIEGVSTSTAGMVGVTQRGPVNEPTLVTSFGDFTRKFGGYLDHRVFTGQRDLLPYAVEGFFTNGGQRVYITRVIGSAATFAQVDLYGIPATNPATTTLTQQTAVGATTLVINDGSNIGVNDRLLLQDDIRSEYVQVQSAPVGQGIRFNGALHFDHGANTNVVVQTVTEGAQQIVTGSMTAAGGLAVANLAALTAGDILRIMDTADDSLTEYVRIADPAAETTVEPGLLFDHPQATTQVHLVTMADATPAISQNSNQDAVAGEPMLSLPSTIDLAAGQTVRIGGATATTREFQVVASIVSSLSIATTPTQFIHAAGVGVSKQVALLRIHARHPGQWGNALRIRVRAANTLETTVAAAAAQNASPIRLNASFGLAPGSVLDVTRTSGTPPVASPVLRQRVIAINNATNEVDFQNGAAAAVQIGDNARSLEFDLIVERLDENGKVVEAELFAELGMDPEHTRYARTIVGAFDRATNRPEQAGESDLIRVSDLTRQDNGADLANAADLRLSIPFANLARQLVGGSDDLVNITDSTYIGQAAADPPDRTGIFTLESIDDIGIVAVPGQTSQDVQNALINHCTLMRYRFAVLDSQPNARLSDIQTQRQQYDTTYGAVYYPWLVIRDAFGRRDDTLNIPPSGHVAGVYARSDVQRGVHKAPANEVILGIRDLQVRLTKGEQDILNPKHINCVRDFRDMNRGLRVWGARTLSSDPEWKYVNVRRLFLFVEKSIERGTQFAVFEPNSEPLWATINRSVTNFLVAVWRSGALEGTKQEEAFFVKVDRTTMTQNDIDNGRLIVLVGIAPVKPAEFVIFRISQKTREAVA